MITLKGFPLYTLPKSSKYDNYDKVSYIVSFYYYSYKANMKSVLT